MSVFDLWLPILVAGVVTHILSSLAWMVLPHHKPEWKRLPAEDSLMDLLDKGSIPAGQYMFPFASDTAEMKSDEFREKERRCRGMLVVWPEPLNMGTAIGKTLAFFFVAAFCIGYVASLALTTEDSFFQVFRVATTVALLTHCLGIFPGVFWFKRQVAMDLLDKVAYAVATGLIFAALWPAG